MTTSGTHAERFLQPLHMCLQVKRTFGFKTSGWLTRLLLNTTCPVLTNSVDPDQLVSEVANWSGTALFVIKMWISVKTLDHVIWLAGN